MKPLILGITVAVVLVTSVGCAPDSPPSGSGSVAHHPEPTQFDELSFEQGAELDASLRPAFETTLLADEQWELSPDDDPTDGLNVLWHSPTACRVVLYQASTDGLNWDLSSDEMASRRAIEDYILNILAEAPGDVPIYASGIAEAVTFAAIRRSSDNDLVLARAFASIGVYLMLTVTCPVGTDPVTFYTDEVYEKVAVTLDES